MTTSWGENKQRPRPRYSIGERLGKFVVQKYLAYTTKSPATGQHLSKNLHWYELECDCGNVEIANQQQLQKRHQCLECCGVSKSQTMRRIQRRTPPDPSVPNFATMRLGAAHED